MRQFTLVLISIFTLFGCNSNQPSNSAAPEDAKSRCETSVKEYLKINIDDPESYEPDKFKDFNAKIDDGAKHAILSAVLYCDSSIISEKKIGNASKAAILEKKKDSLNVVYENTGTEVIGYTIDHKFRAKNSFGAKVWMFRSFELNKDFVVIRVNNLDYWLEAVGRE